MRNKGQFILNFKWFTALFLMFFTLIAYEFVIPVVKINITNAMLNTGVLDGNAKQIIASTNNQLFIAFFALMLGYLFMMFIAGLPGQQEERLI